MCLATNVYRPEKKGTVGRPVLGDPGEHTIWKDNDVYYASHWVKQGYVVILQDVRVDSIQKVRGNFYVIDPAVYNMLTCFYGATATIRWG